LILSPGRSIAGLTGPIIPVTGTTRIAHRKTPKTITRLQPDSRNLIAKPLHYALHPIVLFYGIKIMQVPKHTEQKMKRVTGYYRTKPVNSEMGQIMDSFTISSHEYTVRFAG
jgi:hypothetical protein